MEIKNARVAVCTQKDQPDKMMVYENIIKYGIECDFCLNNTASLTRRYNEAIDMALKEDADCLILVHDDVELEKNPIPKLEKLFNEFDLVGVAGTKTINLQSPALWHIMGGGFQSGNLHGTVKHIDALYGPQPTYFGPVPQRVVMIDGVFMALNRKCMETMRFDESNPAGFHFYDLSYSLDCHLAGLKVGVGDILITHASPGLREFTDEWKMGDKWFLDKYKD